MLKSFGSKKTVARLITLVLLGQFILGLGSAASLTAQETGVESVVIAGLGSSQLKEVLKGRVLIEELNCAGCHAAPQSIKEHSKKAPRLSGIGSRMNPYYLQQFIESPHQVKPGTTMPQLLSSLGEKQGKEVAAAITHFLLSTDAKSDFHLIAPDEVAAEKGRELFHTVGCVACHSPRDGQGKELMQQESVPLGDLEKKYNVSSLVQFLSQPHRIRPSGRMPDLKLPRRDLERIAHYLVRRTRVPGHLKFTLLRGRVWEGLEVNVEKEKAGHVDDFSLQSLQKLPQNSALIYEGFLKSDKEEKATFLVEMNGGELWINDQRIVDLPPSSRRGVKKASGSTALRSGWNRIKVVYIHAGKEPSFDLKMESGSRQRAAIPARLLSIYNTPIEPYVDYQVDPVRVKKGAKEFLRLGCIKCHDDVKNSFEEGLADSYASPPSLEKLDEVGGCLSEKPGPWPKFSLSRKQKDWVRKALPDLQDESLDTVDTVDKSLVTFNCLACHDRAGLGGVSAERNALFTGDRQELGNDGRIPPPLTLVGAKLQKDCISDVMLRGQRQRLYMTTRMPQFGEANVGHLVDLFEQVDRVEKVEFEPIEDLSLVKRAGHQLIGTTGFSCVGCHDFNGQKAAGPGAMEMINTTKRLKKDWFYWYMLNPARFNKTTIMPAAWPGGHVFMEDILDGDAKKQIESVWVYLSDGRRAKAPVGLSRKSPELRVADETLVCRGRGNAGYRGMAIGYPERLSLAFDTQEMSLRLMWKGDFATVNNGSFSARGVDRISFPQGIPFHRLQALEDNWPYKRKTDYLFPGDHGYRFDGYFLDKEKRPTLMYRYGDIRVEDFFEDRLDREKKAFFRRTLTFDTPGPQQEFFFRVGSAGQITKSAANAFSLDRLKILIKGNDRGLIRPGEPKELLVPIQLPKGKTTLILDYKW